MADKVLLIGVDALGQEAVVSLPSLATSNVRALQAALTQGIGQFAEAAVETLINPDAQQLRQAITRFATNATPGDLRLLYLYSAGLMDCQQGTLYFNTHGTQLENLTTTAVSIDFLRGTLDQCLSAHQAVIVDFYDSAVVAPEVSVAALPTLAHLASDHRAVLVGNSVPPNLNQARQGGSPYTRLLVQGITSEWTDLDANGIITAAELYRHIRQAAQTEALSLRTGLYAPGDSDQVQLIELPVYQPTLEYRRSVEEYVEADDGVVSEESRRVLDFLAENLALDAATVAVIEAEVLEPFQRKQQQRQEYEAVFRQAIALENPPQRAIRRRLHYLQRRLELSEAEVQSIETTVLPPVPVEVTVRSQRNRPDTLTPVATLQSTAE
jgi:hypothetical protein